MSAATTPSVSLFPGAALTYFNDEGPCLAPCLITADTTPTLAITHCHKGQLSASHAGKTLHLGPGDFLLQSLAAGTPLPSSDPSLPCEGLSLFLDPPTLFSSLPLLGKSALSPSFLSDKFLTASPFAAFAGNLHSDALFTPFYASETRLRRPYQQLKALELLLFLAQKETHPEALTATRAEQIRIVREIHDLLTHNMDERITIDALAHRYLINPTTLKETFKSIYGSPLAAHIKAHRMELAARLLTESTLSVAAIARRVGYESQSRFTSAFKAQYHLSPSEYRKKGQSIPHDCEML